MDEFALIKKCFAPLAKDFPGSLNLTDDAAVFAVPAGQELVVTKDAIVEGVHFLGHEEPGLIARKLMRVNLSDLAAMGATPLCYFLAVMLPKTTGIEWLQRFAAGLTADQQEFAIHLAGGDTTATPGPLCLSLTALGTVPEGKALKRSGAKVGDLVYVSGTLGDAALGLKLLQGNPSPRRGEGKLVDRYLLPQPRIALGQQLRGLASACIDVSDGLVQDLGHICETSGTGADIERDKIPLSETAAQMIKDNPALWDAVLAGGDDYELLFTLPPGKEALPGCMRIGIMTEGRDVRVLDESGKLVTMGKKGFRHF